MWRTGMNAAASSVKQALLIDADHPSLAGHFPGNPVVPGVVILDAVVAAAIAAVNAGHCLRRLLQVKFVQPLLPGQQATIELSMGTSGGEGERVRFRVLRGDALIASGDLLLLEAGVAA